MAFGKALQRVLGVQHDGSFGARHRWLFGGFGVNTVAQFMFSSVLAVYLHRQGMEPLAIGAVMLVFHVCMRCTGPICGMLVDAYGGRVCLLLAAILSAVGYAAAGFAHGFWQDAASLAVLGFGLGLDQICRSTLLVQVSETSDEGNRALAFYYVVFNFAASCGPLLSAAALGWDVPLRVLLLVVASICLVTGVMFTWLFPFPPAGPVATGRRPSFHGLGVAWRDRRFRALVLALPLIWFLFSLMHAVVPVLLMEAAHTRSTVISAMFSVNAILVVVLGYRVNRWMVRRCDARGRSKLDGIALGAWCMGLALFSLIAMRWLPNVTPLVFITVFTLGELCFVPMIQVLVNESSQAPGATPGPYFGLAMLAWGVGGGSSNVVGGLVVQLCRTHGFALFPIAFGVAALLVALVFRSLSNARSPAVRASRGTAVAFWQRASRSGG